MEADRFATVAAFDIETERIFVVTANPWRTNVQLAAYESGDSNPLWTQTFASLPDNAVNGSSAAWAAVVAPQKHLIYVGGGYMYGTGSGPSESAGYVYAFDTRGGGMVWRHLDALRPGMGGYSRLVKGSRGSVVAVRSELVKGKPTNRSGSYRMQVASFDAQGRERWRWTDRRVGGFDQGIATTNALVFVGETYIDGWARAYRVALDESDGTLRWRHVTQDGTKHFYDVDASPDGETFYVSGTDQHKTGGQALLQSLASRDGRVRWSRWYGRAEGNPDTDHIWYYDYQQVGATSEGVCASGALQGRTAHVYEPILPDNGFIGCYSSRGKQSWIDQTGAPSRVLQVVGERILWAGRQEMSRVRASEEVLRYAIRSVTDGAIHHSSELQYRTAWYDSSRPLLAFETDAQVHFITAMTHERNLDGTIKGDEWLFDRIVE